MPIDIATVESAWLGGSTRFDDWLADFEFKWNVPILEGEMSKFLRNMDPITETYLETEMPTELRELKEKYGSEGE